MSGIQRSVPLEKAAADFADANARRPYIYELPPAEGRKVFDEVQNAPVKKHHAKIEEVTMNCDKWGSIKMKIVTPERIENHGNSPNVIFYIHGAGWVFGNAHTHDKLVRELAARCHSIVLVPEYSLSPEVRFPVAIEQCYSVLTQLGNLAKERGWCVDKLTVSGDSVGGGMATVMTLMAKDRNGPKIHKQLLFYPVTDCGMNTGSYEEFASNYFLTKDGMAWFWNQYTQSTNERQSKYASPLRASTEELSGLPPALVINGQADVLRDEGEAYATALRKAGVSVTNIRLGGMIHDFVMVNCLDDTNACRCAMDAATEWVRRLNRA